MSYNKLDVRVSILSRFTKKKINMREKNIKNYKKIKKDLLIIII